MASVIQVLLYLLFPCVCAVDWNTTVPLDEYVWADDGHYSWEIIAEYRLDDFDCDLKIINMTSQKWMDENYSNHPIWWHIVGVAIPDTINYNDAGVLFINGGSNRRTGPPSIDDLTGVGMCAFASESGSVAGYISQIPNQPIVFTDDPDQQPKSEDTQIAYTWRTFFENPAQPNVLSRFPMTKACVKALDTINTVAKQFRPETDVKRFIAAGASKRGWTVWTLAAVDRRMIGILPMVMDLLNMYPSTMNHYRSMNGAWSFAFQPYYRENLTQVLDHPNTFEMMKHVDPYSYLERLTMPKLIISTTGDEFFLLDDTHFFWDDLRGPKYLMMNENSHHSMFPHYLRIYENAMAFYLSILDNTPIPEMTWTRGEDATGGYIEMTVGDGFTANRVRGHVAVTTEGDSKRDFRMSAGSPPSARIVPWNMTTVEDLGEGRYRITADKVQDRWVGMVMDARFDGPDDTYFYLMTEVNIIPNTYPADICEGAACYGTLV